MSAPAVPRRTFMERVVGATTTIKAAWRAGADAAYRAARGATVTVAQGATGVKDGVVGTARAVTETAQRAVAAPKEVAAEVRKELDAWTAGLVRTLGLGAVVAVLALFALGAITIGVAVALDRILGAPYGTLVVGAIYALATAIAAARLRAARRATRAEVERHAEHARDEIAYVGEPLRTGEPTSSSARPPMRTA